MNYHKIDFMIMIVKIYRAARMKLKKKKKRKKKKV